MANDSNFSEPRIAPDEKIEVQKVKPISYNEPDKISSTKTALLFFAGAVFITGLCVAVAAIIAKCRKRGDYKKMQVEFTRLIDE